MTDDIEQAAALLRRAAALVPAMTILMDAGVPERKAGELVAMFAQEYDAGATSRNPEQMARHFVALRKAAQ